MVEQCGATVEQCWWNSGVEQWNSVGGIVEQFQWNSGTVMLEQCRWNSDGGTLRGNSVRKTVWWTSGTVKMEQ